MYLIQTQMRGDEGQPARTRGGRQGQASTTERAGEQQQLQQQRRPPPPFFLLSEYECSQYIYYKNFL